MRERLLDDLLWFLERPSVTGEEKLLCDDLEARISRVPGWEIERVSNSLAVRRESPDASREKLVLAGHLDTVPGATSRYGSRGRRSTAAAPRT